MSVELADRRIITIPVAWYPRIMSATAEQRLQYELHPSGIYGDAIDEDISLKDMLIGRNEAGTDRVEPHKVV